jgi:hypothetical protein
MPQRPDLSDIENELIRLFYLGRQHPAEIPRRMIDVGRGLPPVPEPPPVWQGPSPPVTGSPLLGRLVQEYMDMFPEMPELVRGGIHEAPTPGLQGFLDLASTQFRNPEVFKHTNVLGFYDPSMQDIAINPNTGEYGQSLEGVLAHELGHAAGYPHGRALSNIEQLGMMREAAVREQQRRRLLEAYETAKQRRGGGR